MKTIARRHFLGAAAAAALAAKPLGMPIGFQTYPVREAIGKDFAGTLRAVARLGYEAVEMCSPPGYEKSGFGPLIGMKAAEMKKVIRDAGLRCESSHYQFRELKEHIEERAAFARELGLKQMIVASLGLKPDAPLATWQRAAEEMNHLGEKAKKAGLQLGFHNHNGEFEKCEGKLIFDELMRIFDPKLVKSQFQVIVASIGVDPVAVLKQYPGRFISLHLADWAPAQKKAVPVGKGSIDWKGLFANAKTAGVKNYYVEMAMDALVESAPYLKAL
ncbi:MAG: sugar phosphate isomerase/epimerase [Bryobacter sp.]|nr:sugar phosphate isomerase/epimerase [Bryobacter sp.]